LRYSDCFAVGWTADEEYLELVKSALLAALEALPPVALFGVITFSDKVGILPTCIFKTARCCG
jgi:secreted protein with Ig-like and vWFA domain